MKTRKQARRGFTLVEALITAAVIAILAALLLPAFQRQIETARATKCQQNLRTIWMAAAAYSADNDQWLIQGFVSPAPYPGVTPWTSKLVTYVNLTSSAFRYGPTLQCPTAYAAFTPATGYNGTKTGLTIGLNDAIGQPGFKGPFKTTSFQEPGHLILFADQGAHPGGSNDYATPWNTTFTDPDLAFVHEGHTRMNAVFLDGHAASLSKDDTRYVPGKVSYPWTEVPLSWPSR